MAEAAGTIDAMRETHVVRVFTRGDAGGNHLGVVTDVDGLTTDAMQAIATDLGYSETIFVDVDAASVRIFTPADELPFAGHPLVGAAAHLASSHGLDAGHLDTGVGRVAFAASGTNASIECTLDVVAIEPDDVAAVARSAGLPDPVSTARLGLPKEYMVAEYPDFAVVADLAPDMEALTGRFGFLAWARDDTDVKARFFAPGTAVPEDPATGSAAVALAHTLRMRGEESGQLTVLQGDEIGHPSTIHLSWTGPRTTIGGSVRTEPTRTIT